MAEGKDDNKSLESEVERLQLLERRTDELLKQRRLERACLEAECQKMERQKKYLMEMLRENEDAAEIQKQADEAKKPFHGTGHVLGAPTQSSNRGASSTALPTVSVPSVPVDMDKPHGSIQVRLGDGGRLVVKLNHYHTIRHLKQQIQSQTPQQTRPFVLFTTDIPNIKLDDDDQSLENAGIFNSAILQRFV